MPSEGHGSIPVIGVPQHLLRAGPLIDIGMQSGQPESFGAVVLSRTIKEQKPR